ncbi:unnamed protein product [Plutella xylostella]|uniref:(diamondback moth) hypothetical protein n=1 Tax=Plutella xylostella TaxID=51655 RepID=A0A8S4FKP9_PLUXY|nr:unnamed protein product [Plutella xylostella]
MSVVIGSRINSEIAQDKKISELDVLDPVLEANDESAQSEEFEKLPEEFQIDEIPPKIFAQKDVKEPLTIEALNNVIYELGIVNLCWPEISEPVFEPRSCFPKSYYTNSKKERLLLAYAENFRQQYHFHFKNRLPLLLEAPNECGLQRVDAVDAGARRSQWTRGAPPTPGLR